MYKATIYFDGYEDSYKDGEINGCTSSWDETIVMPTIEELKQAIEDVTYNTFDNYDIVQEDINNYDFATEYCTSYLTTKDNNGAVSDKEYELWKNGDLRLYSINCQILVSEVIESEARITINKELTK
jgi:hypothetical protein